MDAQKSRSHILTSIRRSLASARHLPKAPSVAPTPQPQTSTILSPTTGDEIAQSLIDKFANELRSISGTFLTVAPADVPALVAALMDERNATALLAWDQPHLPVPGILDYLRDEGLRVVDSHLPHAAPARSERLAEVEQVTIGLTGVDAALADTGSLALRTGPGRPRLASLSVRTHIALFTPNQLYPSWAAWWEQLPNKGEWVSAASRSSSVTLISGPSRTADIEMTLTVGVHGPGEVIAILCV
jgi:L-lactate dehydrogenase complex protein LldG